MALVTIPCLCCGRPVTVEDRWVRAAHREDREYLAWCGRRCHLRYLATEGKKAVIASLKREERQELERAGYLDPGSSEEPGGR